MTFRAALLTLFVTLCVLHAHPVVALEPLAASSTALADLDPDNDNVVAPPELIADCEQKLQAAGVDFVRAKLPVKESGSNRPTCGVEQAVVYRQGPTKIRYNVAPILSCGMALGLARFEIVVNQEAQRYLRQSVVRAEQGGTYNCRKMARFGSGTLPSGWLKA